MMVCAPGAIPRQPGDRVKTDTRDALKLARLLAAGQLRPVVVPEPELEALRDLVRCREDLRGDLMACRHRITKLLLRRGLIYPGPGAAWTRRHASWLGSLTFSEPLVQVTFAEHLSCHEVLLARRDRLDHLIAEQATTGPWAPLIARLRCLRGIDTLTAIGLLTEVGDFTAFAHPRRLASFVGLTPSESSSGDRRRQGSITKCGSSHARRLLDRSVLALPTPPRTVGRSAPPPSQPATRRDRRRMARPAQTPPPLDPPRRRPRQETHHRRGRRRPRTRVLCLGDRQPTRPLTALPLTPLGVWVAAGARNRDPRSRYEHRPTRRRARC